MMFYLIKYNNNNFIINVITSFLLKVININFYNKKFIFFNLILNKFISLPYFILRSLQKKILLIYYLLLLLKGYNYCFLNCKFISLFYL